MENILHSDFNHEEEMLVDGNNFGEDDKDPYENFMKRHLQHYGYFTGRNSSYRENFRNLQEWKKNYDVRLSGHHNLSMVEEQLGRTAQFPVDNPSVFSTDGQLPDDLLHRTTQLVFQYQAGRKIPKLREPRNLYALTKEAGPQQATRWPSHMQVVCPAIRFIDYNPATPYPLYQPTGKELTPGVRGPQSGEMIYYNDPGRDLYFMRSRVAGCRLAMRSTTLTPRQYPDDNYTLEFESRFESGNLLKVDKITDFDYELTLRTDLYTNKHTQWFFFRVRNMRPERTYRFTIVNLMKPSSLYNQGMKPVWYSEINAKKHKIGWTRGGSNIRYYRNNLCGRDGRTYYSLTWTCEFPHKDDCCYFAHCFPYTYSDLQEYLLQLANDPVRSRFCKQRVLTRTLAGNLVYILTITSPSRNPDIARSKRAVVLTARVHPGETNSSWMMKGFLDYLTGTSADAKLLRDSFIFKIVPMLNPDGVIVGNYRCSLAGRDLNRNYKSVLKDSFPSIWHTKMMIKRLNAEREVVVYCDLHGHSRKNNIFIYGCENKHNRQRRLQERVFPMMLSKNASQTFSFESCKYKVQKSKEGTGRIVVWYMGVMNSYTMEATFGGSTLAGERKNTHLGTNDLEMMGYHFCDTLLDYCDPDRAKVEACMRELQDNLRRQILKKLQLQNENMSDVNIDDYISDMESDTSGSDSSCDDGLPVHLLAIAPKLQRKKKYRSRRDRGKGNSNKTTPSRSESEKSISNPNLKQPGDKIKTLRYTQLPSSAKKRDDKNTPSFSSLPSEHNRPEKAAKKLPTVTLTYIDPLVGILLTRSGFAAQRSNYLEALTSAYLRSGVLLVPEPEKVDYSLKYTNKNGGNTHDENFTVQYLAHQLGQLSGVESDADSKRDSPLMRNASCQWSPQPDTQPGSDSDGVDSVDKEAILAEEQYELFRQSALRRQLSSSQQRLLAQKHLVAVAAMQKRREENSKRHSSAGESNLAAGDRNLSETRRLQDDSAPDPLMVVTRGVVRPASRAASTSSASCRNTSEKIRAGRTSSATVGEKSQLMSSARSNLPPSTETVESKIKTIDSALQKPPPASTSATVSRRSDVKQFFGEATSKNNCSFPQEALPASSDFAFHESESNQKSQSNSFILTSHDRTNEAAPVISSASSFDKKSNSQPRPSNLFFLEDNLKNIPVDSTSRMLGNSPTPLNTDTSFLSADSSPSRIAHTSSEHLSNGLRNKLPHTTIAQIPLKGLVKGELALPRSIDATVIPTGIRKTTSLILDPEPEKLTVQSTRYMMKGSPTDVSELHSQKYKNKSYQSTDDSFFGMSDRIGMNMGGPRGGRVPPVVANIAELRRSLMGQGRDGTDHKQDSPRRVIHPSSSNKVSEEGFHPRDDVIPFSQRPRRRNPISCRRSRSFADMEDSIIKDPVSSSRHSVTNEKALMKQSTTYQPSLVEQSSEAVTVTHGDPRHCDSAGEMADEDLDNMSTVGIADDRKLHQHSVRRDTFADRKFGFLSEPFNSDINQLTSRSESEHRSYTQGNATIERSSDHSLTNIRIGSRTTSRSRPDYHWGEYHKQQDGGGSPARTDKHTLSAVSLNIKGDNDDRTCITTPALASRPVPPLLRYLSAKQGQNKRKS